MHEIICAEDARSITNTVVDKRLDPLLNELLKQVESSIKKQAESGKSSLVIPLGPEYHEVLVVEFAVVKFFNIMMNKGYIVRDNKAEKNITIEW